MSGNAAILGLHFLLELAALAALAYWGWITHDGLERWVWTIGLPVVAAFLWALLRTPGDGPDPVLAIPGLLRLVLELAILGGAAVALYVGGRDRIALAMAVLVVVDYALSYDRVARLIGM